MNQLNRVVMWLSRQYDKTRSCNELVQWGNSESRWYVQYNENERSTTMLYSTAKAYAKMFGGKVKHINVE